MGDLDKLIVVKGFKKLPKSNKSTNLVTLVVTRRQTDKTSINRERESTVKVKEQISLNVNWRRKQDGGSATNR